ncbi:MAG: DNA polymerase III subunit delta' [Candidatus Poribacteria bacterium]|nr:DNA polymerase III subunit delta' [Candidatus Poribacteria bacterium]
MENVILGHQNIVTQLQNAVASERVAGAYLFAGVQGIGKETVALYFANLILCEQRTEEASPCGECRACRKIKSGNHPDLRIIRPDGAQIKIDQIRDLQQQIFYQPLEGPRKIYILASTERMNPYAANSLLKTLEEPPAASTLILLTENIESMLLTIRSRCQVLSFYPMPIEQLTVALMDHFSIDKEAASTAAVLSGGIVGKAITLIEEGISETETVPEILEETDPLAAFRLAEQFVEKGVDSLDELITWYRDLLFLQQGAPVELLTHSNALGKLQILVPRYSRTRLQQAIKTVFETKELLKRTNVTKIFVLEIMCLKLLQGR